MDIGSSDTSFDLRGDDLRTLTELGHGNGGTVSKVEHIPTKTIMAKKVCFARRIKEFHI
jgi:mitogen-activated protein kinase kinase